MFEYLQREIKQNSYYVPKPLRITQIVLTVYCFSALYIPYPRWLNFTIAIALMVCICIIAEKYKPKKKKQTN